MNSAQLLQVVIALLFIVGLLLSLGWVARRSGWIRQRMGGADLKILGSLRLGARASVALIQVEDARLVVGVTAQQITLLHALPTNETGAPSPGEDPTAHPRLTTGASTTTPGSRFADSLGKALGKR